MAENFAKFRSTKEKVNENLLDNPDLKKVIKEFVISKSELSDNALVSLVVFHNTKSLNDSFKQELEDFKMIENNQITEKGLNFLNDPKTIEYLKAMIQ